MTGHNQTPPPPWMKMKLIDTAEIIDPLVPALQELKKAADAAFNPKTKAAKGELSSYLAQELNLRDGERSRKILKLLVELATVLHNDDKGKLRPVPPSRHQSAG